MSAIAFLAADPDGYALIDLRDQHTGNSLQPVSSVSREELAGFIAETEARHSPRWAMLRTTPWMQPLAAAGVFLAKAYILSLAQRILHRSPLSAKALDDFNLEQPPQGREWANQDALFSAPVTGESLPELIAMYLAQRDALPQEPDVRRRLELLIHAESVGAVIACEMEAAGLPWDEPGHRALLREQLGERVSDYGRPPKLAAKAQQLAEALGSPGLNPDSPQELLRALQKAGFAVGSVRAWELEQIKHPLITEVLEYKKLSRLASTHGDAWLDQWVENGRFHPHYVLGTVISGRWAASGGGALQLPHSIRQVVRAPAGSTFVVADGRQLEPRILAAISHDQQLQKAGQQDDLYQWLLDAKLVASRDEAKLGMLSVIYGGGGGASGSVGAALTRSFPTAMRFVEQAALAGEQGGGVRSFLGRGCPPADEQWLQAQRATSDEASQRAADSAARARGRFTRNFVVQATAAEWALVWMGHARHLIHQAGWSRSCRQVFFVHDEIVFECPTELAGQLQELILHAAMLAGRSLFGQASPRFPVSVAISGNYADAK
ncbi:bifunctional 3'-5' exonuclease/DNA polymerase [Glutamicibacter sp. 0426]|uniref:bifunctional 3'-5' exonuclease/DNA polymerase n=1 Tax=Glutamicibacter sp. 0426 TaxID=1913445 RepID=UPI00093923BD|nr:bifunctional 3'-5' exonuclease/DNA polymerase [Glutamicibacter sp. 0426]